MLCEDELGMASLNFLDLPCEANLLKLSLPARPWKDFLTWSLLEGVLLAVLLRRFANYDTCPGPIDGARFVCCFWSPPLSLFKGELVLEFPRTDWKLAPLFLPNCCCWLDFCGNILCILLLFFILFSAVCVDVYIRFIPLLLSISNIIIL